MADMVAYSIEALLRVQIEETIVEMKRNEELKSINKIFISYDNQLLTKTWH